MPPNPNGPIAKPSVEWLRQKYEAEGLGCPDIAAEVGCDPSTVRHWLVKAGIQTRPRGADPRQHFKVGCSMRTGIAHTAEAKEKVGAASRARGAVPYRQGGQHWLVGKPPSANPRWIGGVTADRQKVANSQEWKTAVRAVYTRENGTCQRCGVHQRVVRKAGRKMHVHHVVSFMVPELRCDQTNLVLLCDDCHFWVHSRENVTRLFLASVERAASAQYLAEEPTSLEVA